MEYFCEYAVGLHNRNRIVPLSEFNPNGQREEVYRSLFLFDSTLKTWVDKTGSVSGYHGTHLADTIPFDFDGEDLAAVKSEVEKFIGYLSGVHEVPLDYIRLAFSGSKGFHVVLPVGVFTDSPESSNNFARTVKSIAGELGQGFSFIDMAIYEPKRLFRVLNTINAKSGLYKIPLTFTELRSLSVDEIKKLARNRRDVSTLPVSEIHPVQSLSEMWLKWFNHDFAEPNQTAKRNGDIVTLLEGAERGNRNDAAIKLAGTYLAAGLNESVTLATLKAWNRQNEPPLSESELETLVHGAFQRYQKKTVEVVSVYSLRDAGKLYGEYIDSMSKAKVTTGFDTVDKKLRGIMPGQTLCILGKTSVGKSAFLQNVGLNYAKLSGKPVLMFSMEMPITSVFERAAQIEFELSGQEIEDGFQDSPGAVSQIAEMLFSRVPNFYCIEKGGLSLEDIEASVRYTEEHLYHDKTGLVLIDYVGLVKSSGKDIYEQVSRVARGMKDLAKSLNVPIAFLSQVNRNYSEFDELQINAARDSGAVDEASDFILGLWKEKQQDERSGDTRLQLGILKNRQGGIGTTPITMERKTLRMKERSS